MEKIRRIVNFGITNEGDNKRFPRCHNLRLVSFFLAFILAFSFSLGSLFLTKTTVAYDADAFVTTWKFDNANSEIRFLYKNQ